MTEQTPGYRLRAFAKAKFGTLTAFGQACGLSSSEVTYYVKDQREPRAEMLQRWQGIGLSIDWYLSGRGRMLIPEEPTRATEPQLSNEESAEMSLSDLGDGDAVEIAGILDAMNQKLLELQEATATVRNLLL